MQDIIIYKGGHVVVPVALWGGFLKCQSPRQRIHTNVGMKWVYLPHMADDMHVNVQKSCQSDIAVKKMLKIERSSWHTNFKATTGQGSNRSLQVQREKRLGPRGLHVHDRLHQVVGIARLLQQRDHWSNWAALFKAWKPDECSQDGGPIES